MYANVLFTLMSSFCSFLWFFWVHLHLCVRVTLTHLFNFILTLHCGLVCTHHYALPFPDPPSSALGELKRKEEQSGRSIQNTWKLNFSNSLFYVGKFIQSFAMFLSSVFLNGFLTHSVSHLCSHLGLGGAEPLGEIGETGGRPSPSQEPVLAALLLAQAFSLGGGAGITFSGSLEELVEGGCGDAPGEEGSPSLPLKTSFSPERSLSRHRDPIGWKEEHSICYCFTSLRTIFQYFNHLMGYSPFLVCLFVLLKVHFSYSQCRKKKHFWNTISSL